MFYDVHFDVYNTTKTPSIPCLLSHMGYHPKKSMLGIHPKPYRQKVTTIRQLSLMIQVMDPICTAAVSMLALVLVKYVI